MDQDFFNNIQNLKKSSYSPNLNETKGSEDINKSFEKDFNSIFSKLDDQLGLPPIFDNLLEKTEGTQTGQNTQNPYFADVEIPKLGFNINDEGKFELVNLPKSTQEDQQSQPAPSHGISALGSPVFKPDFAKIFQSQSEPEAETIEEQPVNQEAISQNLNTIKNSIAEFLHTNDFSSLVNNPIPIVTPKI